MVDQRVVEAIGFVPHGLESGLDLLFNLVVVFYILEFDLTFFNQGESECRIEIINKLSQIVSVKNVTASPSVGVLLVWHLARS